MPRFLPRRRPALALVVVACAAALLTACGGGDSTGPDAGGASNVTGTYRLKTVNGQPLPATVAQTPVQTEQITDGSLALDDDGAFRAVITLRLTSTGQPVEVSSDTIDGTYTTSGSGLQLREPDGPTIPATVSGGQISFSIGWTLVFAR